MVVRGRQQAVSTLTELSGLQVRTEVRQVLNMGWCLWFPHPSPSPGQWVSGTVLPVAGTGQRGDSKAQSSLRRLRPEGQAALGPQREGPLPGHARWRLLPPSGNHQLLWVHGSPKSPDLGSQSFPRTRPDTRPEPHSPAVPTSLGGRRAGTREAGLPGRASSWQGVLNCI